MARKGKEPKLTRFVIVAEGEDQGHLERLTKIAFGENVRFAGHDSEAGLTALNDLAEKFDIGYHQ